MKQAKEQVYINLLATKIHDKVTSSAKVTQGDEKHYYTTNIAQYQVAAATTRNVAHILVKTKAWRTRSSRSCRTARALRPSRRSTRPTRLGPQRRQALHRDRAVRPARASRPSRRSRRPRSRSRPGQSRAPVHSQYGWHVIKAAGPIVKSEGAHADVQPRSRRRSSRPFSSRSRRRCGSSGSPTCRSSTRGK